MLQGGGSSSTISKLSSSSLLLFDDDDDEEVDNVDDVDEVESSRLTDSKADLTASKSILVMFFPTMFTVGFPPS